MSTSAEDHWLRNTLVNAVNETIGVVNTSTPSEDHWLLNILANAVNNTICVVIILFNIIGNFGNLNVITATCRNKTLQSKHGWLLVILCSEHSLCLLFEFINVYFALSGTKITRKSCLFYLSPYIFISFLQSTTFIALAIDVLLSFTFVSKYQQWQTMGYCSLLAFAPGILPIAFLTRLWSQVSEELVPLCNPPLSMDAPAVNIWGGLITSINILILIIYGYVYWYSHQTTKRTSDSRFAQKIMRSLTILVLVFCFSWVTCMGMVFLVDYFTKNELIIMLARSYATLSTGIKRCNVALMDFSVLHLLLFQMSHLPSELLKKEQSYGSSKFSWVIFAAISYSQTFYVYYIRSTIYRKEFKKQLCCCKNLDGATTTVQVASISRSINV